MVLLFIGWIFDLELSLTVLDRSGEAFVYGSESCSESSEADQFADSCQDGAVHDSSGRNDEAGDYQAD